MLKGKSKFTIVKGSGTGRIHIPVKVVQDSQFPFKNQQKVKIKVEKNKITIK